MSGHRTWSFTVLSDSDCAESERWVWRTEAGKSLALRSRIVLRAARDDPDQVTAQ